MSTQVSYDKNNIFAKIIRKEIPCHTIYEDDKTLVFMDIMPQSLGHTLVVPKTPSRNILDADPSVLSNVLHIVQRVALASKSALKADGITIMQFNEPSGGQTVFHLHFHVIPRYDGTPLQSHSQRAEDPSLLSETAQKIKTALAL